MRNINSASGCQHPEPRDARPTVRLAARRLLDALDRLTAGTEAPGFHGWENGHGEPAGDLVEEARREFGLLLADTPRSALLLSGSDFDPSAFDKVLRSDAVQRAGRDFGFCGVAEAVWAGGVGPRAETVTARPPSLKQDSYLIAI